MSIKQNDKKKAPLRSIERFHHFRCGHCSGWWGIGDAPADRKDWYCPWCGKKNSFKKALTARAIPC